MYLFNSKTALWNSFKTHFTEQGYAFVHFYTGAVPNSLETTPFDVSDMFEVFNNSKLSSLLTTLPGDPAGSPSDAITRFINYRSLGSVKQHSLMERWNRWKLVPRDMYTLAYHNMDRSVVDNNPAWQESETELRDLHFCYRYSSFMGDTRDRRQYSTNWGYSVPSGRYPAPIIAKYEQEVTLTSLEYFGYSSTSNTPNYYTVEYWDPTLLEGAGDWVMNTDTASMYRTYYERRILEFTEPCTSTMFRFTFGQTYSSFWGFQYFWPLGLEPTWGKEPVTLTWAIVGGYHKAWDGYTNKNQYDSFNNPSPGYPFMLVDVGPVGSGATIELDSENLTGADEPLIQKFDIEFLDELL